jgi:hypothetical protein
MGSPVSEEPIEVWLCDLADIPDRQTHCGPFMASRGAPFARRPSPSAAPLVSGRAPAEGGKTRLLSERQLKQLDAWFRLHREEWMSDTRKTVELRGPGLMVDVAHSDGSGTLVFLLSSTRSEIAFRASGDGKFSKGRLPLPATEVDALIALLTRLASPAALPTRTRFRKSLSCRSASPGTSGAWAPIVSAAATAPTR